MPLAWYTNQMFHTDADLDYDSVDNSTVLSELIQICFASQLQATVTNYIPSQLRTTFMMCSGKLRTYRLAITNLELN